VLRRSVEDVADALGVSRTVYNYLNAMPRSRPSGERVPSVHWALMGLAMLASRNGRDVVVEPGEDELNARSGSAARRGGSRWNR
jgi:hypothetical protein